MKTQYNIDGLDEMEKNLMDAIKVKYPKEFEKLVIQMAYELEGRCKEKTPVDTSRLRDGWRVGQIKRKADGIYIEVYNDVEYAGYVNYGHRMGKTGHKEGVYMLELSMQEMQDRITPYLKSWINKFIKESGI